MNRTAAVVLGATLALTACAGSTAVESPARLPERPTSGQLRTLDGKYVSLAALRGDAALITIIQTWSDYALVEVPLLNEVAERFGDRLTVLCIALDEEPEMVQIFVDTFKPNYEVVQVDNLAAFTGPSGPFGPITMVPTSVLLDAEGRVAARNDGTWHPEQLRDALQTLLGTSKR